MLSFEVLGDGKKIQIECDARGMACLLRKLASLIEDPDHVHLWGPTMGGTDLSEVTRLGTPAAQEVVIDYYAGIYEPNSKDNTSP